MQLCHNAGDPVGVLLIDEGDGHGQHPETDAQRKVLETARLLGLKVILVEIDTTLLGGDRGNRVPTRVEFRPYGQHVVRKPGVEGCVAGSVLSACVGRLGSGACRRPEHRGLW
jgi:hypothetical protein